MNPSANWENWPDTRLGALGVIVLFIAYYVSLHVLVHVYRNRSKHLFVSETDCANEGEFVSSAEVVVWYRWKMVPWKITTLSIQTTYDDENIRNNGEELDEKNDVSCDSITTESQNRTVEICVTEKRIVCPCGCIKSHSGTTTTLAQPLVQESSSSPLLLSSRMNGLSCGSIFLSIIAGFIVSFVLHFVPCIWWTCDLGEGDNGGVRGFIWFLTWPVLSLWCILIDATEQVGSATFAQRFAADKDFTVTLHGKRNIAMYNNQFR